MIEGDVEEASAAHLQGQAADPAEHLGAALAQEQLPVESAAEPSPLPIEEAPPPGIPPELLEEDFDVPDLATVVAEMTALRQEVRLQARTFKKLQEALLALTGSGEDGADGPGFGIRAELAAAVKDGFLEGLDGAAEVLAARDDNRKAEMEEAYADGFLDAAEALMDTYERLETGLREARRTFRRLEKSGNPDLLLILPSILRGQAFALSRLSETLAMWEIRPLARPGRAFDRRTMLAVAAAPSRDRPPGIVLEVWRQGFVRGEEILRLAEVKVAAEAAGMPKPAGG